MTQTLDPIVQEASTFSHTSVPQPNIVQSVTPVLVFGYARAQRDASSRGFSRAAA